MAERSGFFDAHVVSGEYDRVYLAEDFAKYFASFIGNGVFGGKSDELMISQNEVADMSVIMETGQGYIEGYFYENTDELRLVIEAADGVLNRIDSIVLRKNKLERVIRAAVKKGVPASAPSAPLVERSGDNFELELARVYVAAGATKITQANITDMRLDSNVCGLVTGVVKQLDTTELGAQLNAYIIQYAAEYREWLDQFYTDSNKEIEELKEELDAIVADNNLVELTRRVDDIAIEDDIERGCYYRINKETGMKEWLNPPLHQGWFYPLAERWKNKQVFQVTVYAASLPNNSAMVIEVPAEWNQIVSVSGFAYDKDDLTYYPFPVTLHNQVTPIAVISRVEGDGSLIITTNGDASRFEAEIIVKYIRD